MPLAQPEDSVLQVEETLAADLQQQVSGEVRFDLGSRAAYGTDASNYRQVPIGVASPRTVEAAASRAWCQHSVPSMRVMSLPPA
jgi:hypothetical protein